MNYVTFIPRHKDELGMEVQLQVFLTSATDGNEWSASRLRSLYPWGKSTRYSFDRRLGWYQGQSGSGSEEEKSLSLPGIETRSTP